MAFPASLRSYKLPVLGNARLRIAQLTPGCAFDSVTPFPPADWRKLDEWAPHSLIASSADLQRLIERIEFGTVRLQSLDHSIYILTAAGDRPLSDQQRSHLWDRFGVAVYELFTDHARVLAFECEAHEGWHFSPDAPFAFSDGELLVNAARDEVLHTGLSLQLDTQPCPCGRPAARLVPPAQHDEDLELPVAA